MKTTLILTSILTVLAWPTIVLAESDVAAGKKQVALEEVVVSAGRVEETKREVTSNVIIVDEEEIKASSAKDVGELLAEKNVGYIKKYPGALTSVGIRGFRTETHGNDLKGHVLVLLNGRRAGTGNLAKIMTKNVEKIEIIKGPGSVQYGSAGMGGVINVITKRGQEEPRFFVEGGLGSYGCEEESAGFSGKYKKFDFSGSFSRSSMDDYETGDGDTFHNAGFDEQISASANLGFEFLPNNRIGVILNTFEVDHSGSPEYRNKNDRDDYSDKENRSVDFTYEGATSDTLYSWQARYFLGKDVDTWYDPTGSNPSGYDNGIPSERETDQEGAQAQITANRGIFRLTAGLDWAKYDIETTWKPQKTEYDSLAGYFLGRAKVFHDRLILTGGLRYDTYELDVLNDTGAKQDSDDVNFTAGAAFLFNDFVKLRINFGEAFIIPSADQLAADYVSSGTQYLGNPDLDPEKSRTYEAGVDFTYAASSASITYFHTDYKDKIESVTSGSVKTWENIGEATISGFEGNFSTDLGAVFAWDFEVRPYVNIVYLTEFESDDTGEDLHDVCEINASYGVSVSDYDRFSAKLNFAYTGEQTITDYSAGYPYPVVKKGGFTVANLTVTQKIYEKSGFGALYLRGEINNLFDRDYEYVAGYPMPGRSFFLGLKYVL